jgi:hypothetical protein
MRSSSTDLPPNQSKTPFHSATSGVVLFLVAFFLYFIGRAPFLGQWDSFDYLKQTVTHRLSDLAFGRPVFIGYNIILWELSKRLFGLTALQVGGVVTAGVIGFGSLGVLLFRRLARQLLPGSMSRMATLAFLLSPMYAVYSGSVMTEVPMLVAILATAIVLWESGERHPIRGPLAGGLLFGLAVGIREQAATLGAACLWILWERRPDLPSRMRAWLLFALSAGTSMVVPILVLYLHDPAAFFERTRTWMHAIPVGGSHFLKNMEAALLFALAVCPGAWLALSGGGILFGCRRAFAALRPARTALPPARDDGAARGRRAQVAHPVWGFFCGFVLPMAVLWRDADVQMHPRYLLIILPSALLIGACLYSRLLPSSKAAVAWAVLQIFIFGLGAITLAPIRQIQYQKRAFASLVRETVSDDCLLIAGGFSPVLDFNRGLGDRPNWRILWSGWGWSQKKAETTIRDAWARHAPVYLCDAPFGWLMIEDERLDIHFILKDCCREVIAPGISRYYPRSSPTRP